MIIDFPLCVFYLLMLFMFSMMSSLRAGQQKINHSGLGSNKPLHHVGGSGFHFSTVCCNRHFFHICLRPSEPLYRTKLDHLIHYGKLRVLYGVRARTLIWIYQAQLSCFTHNYQPTINLVISAKQSQATTLFREFLSNSQKSNSNLIQVDNL